MDNSGGEKPKLRKQLMARRDAIPVAERKRSAETVAQTGLGFIAKSFTTVSGFYPFGSELDARPLLTELARTGHTTSLPVIVGKHKPLIFRAWKPGDSLIGGVWNIPVPGHEAAIVTPDIVLVPLLGFDDEGYRIGYGGGYYDRTLALLEKTAKVTSIGLAFAVQHVPYIPREAHDVPLDWIFTEQGPVRGKETTG